MACIATSFVVINEAQRRTRASGLRCVNNCRSSGSSASSRASSTPSHPYTCSTKRLSKINSVLALTEDQLTVSLDSPMESALRRYLLAETKRRLHQPLFASRVMLAYDVRCAVCSLHHRELLDAAHIVSDTQATGIPVVPNGMALCKIHHAAYDQNILGMRPDHVIEIHHRLLHEIDGPMLRHGLQQHHGKPLMSVPRRRADRPDPARLLLRYEQFTAAGVA